MKRQASKYSAGFLVLLVILTASCSTKKNTLISRNYHNLTSHYNIYFNAYEIKREGHKKIESSFQDDFNKILPIDIYTQKEVARRLLPDMDKVIKKCSKVITMHSITSKPKRKRRGRQSDRQKEFYRQNEFNKWIDDAYFLMGQAYYLKHDRFPAITNFEYVIQQFPNDGLKQEANLWLAKTHSALKDYVASKDILDRLEADPELSDRLKGELAVVRAQWHLMQDEYSEAIDYLSEAVTYTKKKKTLSRYTYIIAQLLEAEEEFAQASLKYEEVIKLNPDYRMAFNAKINRAKLYEGDADTGKEIRKQLEKMLNDDKNLEFLDQIYYALAELDIKEGMVDTAIEKYKLSAQFSVDNFHQKSLSYLALGEIFYSRPEYIPAQLYYDSCMLTLPEEFPDRESIQKLSLSLNLLADNLNMIHREDSLQAIAAMSEEDRETLIKIKMDEAKAAEEERARQEEEERMNGRSSFRSAGGGPGGANMSMAPGGMGGSRGGMVGGGGGGMSGKIGGASSQWYFYNPTTLSYGQAEFAKRFGRRKLEDNWRRSNKGISSSMGDMSTEGEEGDISTPSVKSNADQFQPTQRDYYLADLPLNDTLIQESNDRIQMALFNVGKVFKDELLKESEAIEYFELLLVRFPETDRLLFAYYNLYQIFVSQGESDRIGYYKSLILNRFPDSRSAKIISNPNYFKEIEEARRSVINYYTETYEIFHNEQYEQVISNCEAADTAFGLNHIRDKFGLLKVMSIGAIDPGNTALLTNRLNDLLFKYPESDIKETVKILLDYLQDGPAEFSEEKSKGGGLSIGKVEKTLIEEVADYSFDDDDVHFYVAVVSRRTQDLNRLNFNISNFNVDNYDQDFFEVASVPMNDDLMIITVKNFGDAKIGMDYYYALLADPTVFSEFSETDFRHFIISRSNYNLFYKNKNVFRYIQFFKENYLDKDN
ncbi:MAG: tetratricopeptide repeat protein [Bacteroidota bacterium]|nr:tetratricopeptide repeat protein [Bacteroidota bacterium]